jgi:hypothetical protein
MNFLRCNCDVHVARDQRFGKGNYGVVMLVVEAILNRFDHFFNYGHLYLVVDLSIRWANASATISPI